MGGILTLEDLAEYEVEWQECLEVDYRGFQVFAPPLPSAGFQSLQHLKLMECFDPPKLAFNSADTVHALVESAKLSITDRIACAGDPDHVDLPLEGLLSPEYAAAQRDRLDMNCAATVPGETSPGASSPMPWDRPRPSRTAASSSVSGMPGGWAILQRNVQILINLIDFGLDVQQAIEAPQFRLYAGRPHRGAAAPADPSRTGNPGPRNQLARTLVDAGVGRPRHPARPEVGGLHHRLRYPPGWLRHRNLRGCLGNGDLEKIILLPPGRWRWASTAWLPRPIRWPRPRAAGGYAGPLQRRDDADRHPRSPGSRQRRRLARPSRDLGQHGARADVRTGHRLRGGGIPGDPLVQSGHGGVRGQASRFRLVGRDHARRPRQCAEAGGAAVDAAVGRLVAGDRPGR